MYILHILQYILFCESDILCHIIIIITHYVRAACDYKLPAGTTRCQNCIKINKLAVKKQKNLYFNFSVVWLTFQKALVELVLSSNWLVNAATYRYRDIRFLEAKIIDFCDPLRVPPQKERRPVRDRHVPSRKFSRRLARDMSLGKNTHFSYRGLPSGATVPCYTF